MSNERHGVTIKELKNFLNRLPDTFDAFSMVTGEVKVIDNEYYARIDKPVVHLEIDEITKEFLILHQSEENINDILKSVNGDSESTK